MRGNTQSAAAVEDCGGDVSSWVPEAGGHERLVSEWGTLDADPATAKLRLGRLARTLEAEIIPRLALAHRAGPAVGAPLASVARSGRPSAPAAGPTAEEVRAFAARIVDRNENGIDGMVQALRRRGVTVESLYLELFAGAARHLGELWVEDLCDFTTVTVGLGRLQRLLREWGPSFGAEVEHPPNGRRALLAQPADEQHSFGLSMVAEFFRRDGWDVLGGVSGAVGDPVRRVREEWFDLAGFSIGSEVRVPWLRQTIAAVRAASTNRSLVVLVGGPIFTLHPAWVGEVGADGSSADGKAAPHLAENLLLRSVKRS